MRRIVMGWLPWKALHEARDIADVLHNICVEIFESKKKALAEGDIAVSKQIGQGKDILSILSKYIAPASDTIRINSPHNSQREHAGVGGR